MADWSQLPKLSFSSSLDVGLHPWIAIYYFPRVDRARLAGSNLTTNSIMKLVAALQEPNDVRLFQEDAFLYLAVNWVGSLVTRSVVLCSRQGRLPSSGVFQLSSFQECLALSGSSYCLVNIWESGMVIALLSVQWNLDISLLFSIKWKSIGQADCNHLSSVNSTPPPTPSGS